MTRFVSSKVMITGLSVVSNLGCDLDALASSLWAQRRGFTFDHRFGAYTS